MGIINLSANSFSGPGVSPTREQALDQAREMVDQGAAILDIGAEATWPGAPGLGVQEELDRILPVLEGLTDMEDAFLSIETYKAPVADAACSVGVDMINDLSAGCLDANMFATAASHGVAMVLVHMRGTPRTMGEFARYDDLHAEVQQHLRERLHAAEVAGIDPRGLVIDPGLGLAKNAEHTLDVLNHVEAYVNMGHPVLIGASRKFVVDVPPGDRLGGSIAAATIAIYKGARIVRCHDVKETVQAVRLVRALKRRS